MDLGIALLALGTQVVKSACRLWLGDGFAGDMSDTVADLLQDQVPDALQRHRLKGMFEGFAGTVADKASRADDVRFHSLPENEREAAILAVAETFQKAELNDTALFAVNLDARMLEKHLRAYVEGHSRAWGLGERATGYFDFLLRECCSYLLEINKTLPRFTSQALTELLRRTSTIEQQLIEVLDRIPARTSMSGDDGFETDYRRQVANELDYMDLFGASVFERNGGYQLSVAYVSLLVTEVGSPATVQAQGVPVESVLAATNRVFIRGEAGSGKTTLLQWIAVSAARREFPEELTEWNDLVPFFIRLRQFADTPLPMPEEFVRDGVAATLAAEMPGQWVHRILRAGRGIVLIDGVDEVDSAQRLKILEWLRRLVAAFPQARFIVTSRPAAVAPRQLGQQGFRAYFVQPMTMIDISRFIAHWHRAMALNVVENSAKRELEVLSSTLSQQIQAKRYLRALATNPLLCALLCALHRDRRAELPKSRIELFRISLEMFLQRRDSERQVRLRATGMEFDDKLRLLQDIAYWMMLNGLAIAERERVIDLVNGRLTARRHRVVGTTYEVFEYLLERSGLLREPVAGSIDFTHRSFQEYLAAQAAVDRDEIEALTERADDEQWRQVVILAAGLGNKWQTVKIFERLLNPPRRLRAHGIELELTALGCLETATEVDPSVAHRIRVGAEELIPPRSPEHVRILSRVGEYAYDLVADARVTDASALYMAQLAGSLGGPGGMALLERINIQLGPHFDNEAFTKALLQLWHDFDPVEFADRVLAHRNPWLLTIDDARLLPGLTQIASINSLIFRLGPDYSDFTFLARLRTLKQVAIAVDADYQELSLALPHKSCLVHLHHRSHPVGLSDQLTPALVLTGLDSASTLRCLTLLGNPERIVIRHDKQITQLNGLRLPASALSLEVDECRNFDSLTGAQELAGSRLERLAITLNHAQLEQAVAPLLQTGTSHEKSLINQLNRITIHCPANSRVTEVGAVSESLTALGFRVETTYLADHTIDARR